MAIEFTQYLRPHGKTKKVTIDRPSSVEVLATRLVNGGVVFEIEELQTGDVSMTAEHDEEVLAHEICRNGPEVPQAVDRLVTAAGVGLPKEDGDE